MTDTLCGLLAANELKLNYGSRTLEDRMCADTQNVIAYG